VTHIVDLDELTPKDLRELAGLKDGEHARLQLVCDEHLRRHLVRLTVFMAPAERQALVPLLREHHPSAILAEYLDAFLVASAIRAQLPGEKKGWFYRSRDVTPCDDPSTENAPDVDQAPDIEQLTREIDGLERCTPDDEQFVTNAYAAAAAIGITSEEARPIIVTALRARNNPKEYRRAY
jgi:hypothetical protein